MQGVNSQAECFRVVCTQEHKQAQLGTQRDRRSTCTSARSNTTGGHAHSCAAVSASRPEKAVARRDSSLRACGCRACMHASSHKRQRHCTCTLRCHREYLEVCMCSRCPSARHRYTNQSTLYMRQSKQKIPAEWPASKHAACCCGHRLLSVPVAWAAAPHWKSGIPGVDLGLHVGHAHCSPSQQCLCMEAPRSEYYTAQLLHACSDLS